MLISCWSTKGGAGTTVVAASLALLLAKTHGQAVVADLAGDLPCALGIVERSGPGLTDWMHAAPDVPADGLARLEEPVGDGLTLLRRGEGAMAAAPAEVLAGVFAADPRPIVVDCGRLGSGGGEPGPTAAEVLAAGATRSLLVLRPCFIALRRALDASVRPSGIVLLVEEGRALTPADVAEALGVEVLARVRVTEQIARTVDAGLLASQLPKTLARDLRRAA